MKLVLCALLGQLLLLGPFELFAVVVEQVLLPRPLQRRAVHSLLEPRRLCRLGAAPRHAGGRHAGRHAEVPVVGEERRLVPVRLDTAALRRPIVGVPNRPVQPHVLPRGERHLARRVVLVVADRHAVDEDPATEQLNCQPS